MTMTDAIGAIRSERTDLAEQRGKLIGRLAAVDHKLEALDAALEALTGKPPAPAKADSNGRGELPPGRTRRSPDYRAPKGSRYEQALRAVRAAPDQRWTATRIKNTTGMPPASAHRAIEAMLANKTVREVDHTTHGKPVVIYRPTVVRPGEPVAS
jgi:hypothetical protein